MGGKVKMARWVKAQGQYETSPLAGGYVNLDQTVAVVVTESSPNWLLYAQGANSTQYVLEGSWSSEADAQTALDSLLAAVYGAPIDPSGF